MKKKFILIFLLNAEKAEYENFFFFYINEIYIQKLIKDIRFIKAWIARMKWNAEKMLNPTRIFIVLSQIVYRTCVARFL